MSLAVFQRTPLRAPTRAAEPLWLEWVTLSGLFVFGGWLLGVRGVWQLLLSSDPTGITFIIVVVFIGATLWCGRRARELEREQRLARGQGPASEGWVADYCKALRASSADAGAPLDLLLERTHGPHSTLWWVNGIQLKLGLLGKVIGFSILALQIGNLQNFDAAQSQDLLRSLTLGLGVALLTTMVGLVGNILLGLQLTRLDRFADELVALAQRQGLAVPRDLPAVRDAAAAPTTLTPSAASSSVALPTAAPPTAAPPTDSAPSAPP
jgi:hypothetical protein